MTNQMLVLGGNHNGINCIQKTDAESHVIKFGLR